MLVTQSFHSLARKDCVTMDKDDTQLHCNCVGGLKILEFVKLFNTALKRLLNHLVLVMNLFSVKLYPPWLNG